MKTVLVVDSTKERDISLDFGLDKRLYLRVAVHTAKAARVALNTVQFDIAILGDVPDVDDPSSFLKELKKAIPKVFASNETISAAGEALCHAVRNNVIDTPSEGHFSDHVWRGYLS